MKAAVVHDFTHDLRVEDVAKPVPARGEVLVRIETSGLCHTDIHAAHGDWPVKPKLPLIPGHEGVGIVEELGAGVERLKVGDRVAMPWLGSACGVCEYCIDGWETLCKKQVNTGYGRDGSYAEFVTANAAYVAAVPDEVDPLDAAPLTCAGVTTYKAVKVSGARSGQLVAVFGIGGLGHLALQYAKIAGASVVAVDVSDEKLALAKDLGADYRGQCARRRSDRGDRSARWGARGHHHRGRTADLRAGFRLPAPRRHAGTRRAAPRQHGHPADLPDGAERADRGGVDRRHPTGSRRGVRPACVGPDQGDPGDLVDKFLAMYLPMVASLRCGHPLAVADDGDPLPELDFGPLISAAKVAVLKGKVAVLRRSRAHEDLRGAQGEGGRGAALGGPSRSIADRSTLHGSSRARTPRRTRRRSALLAPPGASRLMHEEPFGPVDTIVVVDTEAELLAQMNASNGALVASIACDDAELAGRAGRTSVARRVMEGRRSSTSPRSRARSNARALRRARRRLDGSVPVDGRTLATS